MDKEFLENYHAKEREEINTYLEKLNFGDSDISYPNKKRFHKLKEPVGEAYFPNKSIWPQIPIFGSLIIQIQPTSENLFFQAHGIERKNLDDLIDFSKETGKVQFMINGNPESFTGLDFLSPLFEELDPPITYFKPIASLIKPEKFKKHTIEFDILINLPAQTGTSFKNFYEKITELGVTNYNLNEVLNENRIYYSFFKTYGYNELLKYFEKLLLIDEKSAALFFADMGKFIVDPKIRTFESSKVIPFEILKDLKSSINKSDLNEEYKVYEIGKFLLENKLTFMPESFDACKDVIARYDQEDLYKVSESLHKGVNESNPDLVNKKNIELSDILENVWSDAKLENRIKGVNYGIPISMALIGTLAAGPVGGTVGLMSSLGINVISEIIGVNQDSIGEKLAKKTLPNHIVNIFDFKEKYKCKINR